MRFRLGQMGKRHKMDKECGSKNEETPLLFLPRYLYSSALKTYSARKMAIFSIRKGFGMFPYQGATRPFLVLALVSIVVGCSGPEYARTKSSARLVVRPSGKYAVAQDGQRGSTPSAQRIGRPMVGQPVTLAAPLVVQSSAQTASVPESRVSHDSSASEVVKESPPVSATDLSEPKPADADSGPVLQTSATAEPEKPVSKPVEIANENDNTPPPIPGSNPASRIPVEEAEETFTPPPAPDKAAEDSAKSNADDASVPPVPNNVRSDVEETKPMTANDLAPLRSLYRRAEERYCKTDYYMAHLRRREQVKGKSKPEELILFKFRKKPWSVHFTWLGIEGHHREVIYVQGKFGNLIHTLLAAGDMPLMPAGKRVSLAPDNLFVRSASRHAINEAGLGSTIENFGKVLDSLESGDKKYGTMKYLGLLKRPEFEKPMDAVEQIIPPDCENHLPKGGSRMWMFDTDSRFPLLVVTYDHTNQEVEYYCYDRLQFPSKLDDDDFNPDKLWRHKAR